jgi:hypothetical protein
MPKEYACEAAMDLSSADSLKLPYEGYLLKIKFDREAWWGEVFFSKFVSQTGPHNSLEEALRSTKLRAWKKKLDTLKFPAAIINLSTLVIESQNVPSLKLFGDLLHRKACEFVDWDKISALRKDLDSDNHFRTHIRVCDWTDTPLEGELSGEIIQIPDAFVVCKLYTTDAIAL